MPRIKSKINKPIVIAALLIAAALLAIFYLNQPENKQNQPVQKSTACLKSDTEAANCDYNLDLADSSEERMQGLSGREGLQPQTGMIFIFDNPSEQCFWMKDMKFSIDMIWLNQNKEILKIENNVSPETYPQNFCSEDTKYVVEIPAGEAQKQQYTIGKQLSF